MKKSYRSMALALTLAATVCTTSATAFAANAVPAATAATAATAVAPKQDTKKVAVLYVDIVTGKWLGQEVAKVPSDRVFLNAKDCADTMPKGGYVFAKSERLRAHPDGYKYGINEITMVMVGKPVWPDTFTVRFYDDDTEELISEQVVDAWGWSAFWAIDIPQGNWVNYDLRLVAYPGAFISGQTLDEDYTWFETDPVVEFYGGAY